MDRGRIKAGIGLLFIVLGIAWLFFFYNKPMNVSGLNFSNFNQYIGNLFTEFGGLIFVVIGLFLLVTDAGSAGSGIS